MKYFPLYFQHGITALMFASEKGNMEMVSKLIDAGANVNAITKVITKP